MSKNPFNPFQNVTAKEYRQQAISVEAVKKEEPKFERQPPKAEGFLRTTPDFGFMNRYSTVGANGQKVPPKSQATVNIDIAVEDELKPQPTKAEPKPIIEEKPQITVIGEVFSTYIVAQMNESVFLIDKHAAHERILYNKLKSEEKTEVQALLTPITVTLPSGEYDSIINNISLLEKSGFEVEDFGNSTVIVRALPVFLTSEDANNLLSEIAEGIMSTGKVSTEREDRIFHTVACRAAVKAGNIISRTEMEGLAKRVLWDREIMYCPHGRPVAFEIKKKELEKQFGRIQ